MRIAAVLRCGLLSSLVITVPAAAAAAQAPADKSAAQTPGQAAPSTPPPTGQGAGPTGAAASPAASPAAATLEPQGYNYNPEGRRDPFVSLVRRGSEIPGSNPGERPSGIPGMTAAEVVLKGIVETPKGWMAMLQGTDAKTYLVRPGDRLLDGTVRTITADTMVILQKVNDPLSLETTREVRKVLRQTEEANK
jgi:Tfp pilus assembly protein PilP